MSDPWQVAEGIGWIPIEGFGQINPRRDVVAGGRQYFDAIADNDEVARAAGHSITEGPETWHFEFDQPFFLRDSTERCVEVEISLLPGGRYGVKFRNGTWPSTASGGW